MSRKTFSCKHYDSLEVWTGIENDNIVEIYVKIKTEAAAPFVRVSNEVFLKFAEEVQRIANQIMTLEILQKEEENG